MMTPRNILQDLDTDFHWNNNVVTQVSLWETGNELNRSFSFWGIKSIQEAETNSYWAVKKTPKLTPI